MISFVFSYILYILLIISYHQHMAFLAAECQASSVQFLPLSMQEAVKVEMHSV